MEEKSPGPGATQVIKSRTRRDRSRTSVIGLLRAMGLNGIVQEQFVDLTEVAGGEAPHGNAGNFESIDVISKGPQGTVLRAFDRNIARTVAMKVLLSPGDAPEDKVLRFVHEAQVTGQLEHPNIVPVHEIGVDSRGNVYYVMKFIKGITLQRVIDKLAAGDKEMIERYPLARLLEIVGKVCDAMAFAHSHGVIHRDLKPENIMLGDFGEVLVMDWGLGKILDGEKTIYGEIGGPGEDEQADAALLTVRNAIGHNDVFTTMDGVVMGTPAYMAPEQAHLEGDLTCAADIYALGGILYAMLTLRPPIQSNKIDEILHAKMRGMVTPPTAFNESATLPHCPNGRIPEALSAVALRALAARPEGRYASVMAFRTELERYTQGWATDAEQAGTLRLGWLLLMRHRERLLAWIVAAAAVLLIGGVSAQQVIQANREARAALLRAAGIGDPEARQRVAQGDRALQGRLEAIRAAGHLLEELNPDAVPLRWSYRLVDDGLEVDLSNNPSLRDISPVTNLPITALFLANTGVSDLSPLADLPLRTLVLAGSPIHSIADLRASKLESLDLQNCGLDSLDGIDTIPLRYLDLRGNFGLSLTAMAAHPSLERLVLPADADPAALHTMPSLSFIGRSLPLEPIAEFWRARAEK